MTQIHSETSTDSLKETDLEEWLDLLDNKDILKKTLFTKEKDIKNPILPKANRGTKVKINLETRCYGLQNLIESECYKGLEIIVGDYDVIHGVDLILPMVSLHEKCRVLISPRFGYGSKGKEPDIEPNCRLDCIIEVLEIDENVNDFSLEESLNICEMKKNKGNFWFLREDLSSAIISYKKCIEILENIDEEKLNEKAKKLLLDALNNLSLSYFKSDSLNLALENVDKALEIDSENVKTLFRKAQILEKRNEFKEAIDSLKLAIELEPSNTAVSNLLSKLSKKRMIELKNEKQFYQKMFNEKEAECCDETLPSKCETVNCSSKKFFYAIITISAISTLIVSFLINHYVFKN